ncbi:MAG: BolA family transcriptional regulator [Rhodospirillaceae bacterium]|jgi:BolA protein|nr:BolA family transcriptional regulator [Rhodospirillaceae bacterium]MBT3885367.1 BolA family transcriptional regulator [Rhodospirillaceae bacterium]MBT4116850.1 BolA family transcriptional regulator [Rhodospirillaceae bacterium]MBT4672006.1 BolA family transcriptional regulator [Rhodospirillaceae bacterium]MBT4720092.1 BolA family transcriptional regulator [Rhodospirillaceae bacterium]
MIIEQTITRKLTTRFNPAHLEITNESHMHAVPPGSESHFKVVVVSEAFEGERLVRRHQMVNEILANELAGDVHALAMQTLTAEEWEKKGGVTANSPDCMGGGLTKTS